MKAFIFDPLWDDLVTPDIIEDLKQADGHDALLSEYKELFDGYEDKFLCWINLEQISLVIPR